MKRTEALEFTNKVLKAIDVIQNKYYKEENQGEMVNWAITGLYKSREEQIPESIATRLKKAKTLSGDDLKELLTEVRMALGIREDLDKHKDIDITLQRMLVHLDPYTTYIDPESKRRFDDEITGNFTGIGIQIRKDSITDMLLVVTPIKNSPAYMAGLEAGDIITTITRDMDSQGKVLAEPEVISTKGMLLNDAVKKILGKPKHEGQVDGPARGRRTSPWSSRSRAAASPGRMRHGLQAQGKRRLGLHDRPGEQDRYIRLIGVPEE